MRINSKAAAAKAGGNFVYRFAVLQQSDRQGIQVRVLRAVPQVGVFYFDVGLCIGSVRIGFCHRVAIHIGDGKMHGAACRCSHIRRGSHRGVSALHGGHHLHTGSAVVVQVKVALFHAQHGYIPVNAAVEGEIRHLGIYRFIGAVVCIDHQQVLRQNFRQLGTEGGVAAVMLGNLPTVPVDCGAAVHAVELQVMHRGAAQFIGGECLGVGALASVIVVATVLAVCAVPGVG